MLKEKNLKMEQQIQEIEKAAAQKSRKCTQNECILIDQFMADMEPYIMTVSLKTAKSNSVSGVEATCAFFPQFVLDRMADGLTEMPDVALILKEMQISPMLCRSLEWKTRDLQKQLQLLQDEETTHLSNLSKLKQEKNDIEASKEHGIPFAEWPSVLEKKRAIFDSWKSSLETLQGNRSANMNKDEKTKITATKKQDTIKTALNANPVFAPLRYVHDIMQNMTRASPMILARLIHHTNDFYSKGVE